MAKRRSTSNKQAAADSKVSLSMAVQSPQYNFQLAKELQKYVHDPLGYVKFVYPWGEKGPLEAYHGPQQWQVDTLNTIKDSLERDPYEPIRIARSSGHGVGKSALVSWIIEWSMATCPNCRVLVTANTYQQLMTKTWPEINIWHNRSMVGHWFTVTSTCMYYSADKGYDKTWRADAVTWSVGNTEAFAGLHNKGNRIVIIIDEASAVIDSIWEVIEGALTDEDTEILWLVFGNPTRNTGRFRECFRRFRDLWNTARVDSRSVDVTNKRLYQEWATAYGEDSDFYRVRVTGEFPDQSTGQLISSAVVHEAMRRECDVKDITEGQPKILGIDIAREGEDSSTVWFRQGLYSKRLLKTRKLSTATLSAQIAAIIDREKPDHVFLDMGNVGAAVYDSLKSWGYKDISGIYFQNSPTDDRTYANKRIEMWDKMRIWLEEGGMLPRSTDKDGAGLDIENDLISPEFFYNRSGKKILESKKDMKARGIPSPDDGDALALTFASKIISKRDKIGLSGKHSANQANAEWSPYDWDANF